MRCWRSGKSRVNKSLCDGEQALREERGRVGQASSRVLCQAEQDHTTQFSHGQPGHVGGMCLTNERVLRPLSLDPAINPSVWAESSGMSKPKQLTRAAWTHASAESCRKGPDSRPRCQTNRAPAPGGREEADATICLALRKQNPWTENQGRSKQAGPAHRQPACSVCSWLSVAFG